MKKKMLSLALALIMCLSLIPCAFAAESTRASKFTDVPSDAWYYNELDYAVYNGFISGTSATTFNPDGSLSRAAFVTIMGRMLGAPTSGGSTKFTDVDPDSWYAPYIAWASENGYVNGTSATTFTPNANLTVEQMSAILSNYISKSGVELSGYTASANYKDASSVSGWAVANVEVMRQYGLLHIDANGNVNPRKDASRAEGAYTLVKFAQGAGLGEAPTIIEKPVEPVPASDSLVGKFIVGNPTYVKTFNCLDKSAWDSNIRYMLKNGLSSLDVTVNCVCGTGHDSLSTSMSAYLNYTDLCGGFVSLDSMSSCSQVSEIILRGVETTGSRVDAMNKAIEVHDSLWASGKITSSMTQKQKARVYYDWLLQHCTYGESVNSRDAYGALVEGKVVCEGYAQGYKWLLMLEGIECNVVESVRGNHAWNSAVLDGTLYHIDATWGDEPDKATQDKYFGMTEEAAWARFGGKEDQSGPSIRVEW